VGRRDEDVLRLSLVHRSEDWLITEEGKTSLGGRCRSVAFWERREDASPISSLEFAQDKVRSWPLRSYPSGDKPDAQPPSGKDGKHYQPPKSAPDVTSVVVMLHGSANPLSRDGGTLGSV